MKRLAITLVTTLSVMFSGCLSDENFAFDSCRHATARGVKQLSCGRIIVPITLDNGENYLEVSDDGYDEFTLFMDQREHEYGKDSVSVWVTYVGGGSFTDREKLYNVDVIVYEKNGEDIIIYGDDYPIPH